MRWKSFGADQRGNVAITTALASLPFLVIAGGAIDYSRATVVGAQLQSAVDAATLYGAATDAAGRDAKAADFFASHYMHAAGQTLLGSSFSVAQQSAIGLPSIYAGTASAEAPTTLLNLIRINKITVTRRARAEFGRGDGSCILTLGSDMDLGDPAMVFNGAPRVDLTGCTLRSNKSIKCNGAGLAAFASIAVGDVVNCPNPYPRSAAVPDIHEALKEKIELKCGYLASGYAWAANTTPTGTSVIVTYRAGYRLINVCGPLTLKGVGDITSAASTDDTVIVVENGDLILDADADVKLNRTTVVLSGQTGSHKITFPNGAGKTAKLAISGSRGDDTPWRGVAAYQDPRLTENVDLDWGPGASFAFDGVAYFPRSKFILRGVAETGPSSCSKIVAYSFKSDGGVSLRQNADACAANKMAQYRAPPRLIE